MRDLFHAAYTDAAVVYAQEVGHAISILARSRKYRGAPLTVALQLINSSISLRQCRIHFDNDGNPAGMVLWGWLSSYTMSARCQQGAFSLPLAEWNEGERLCILEVLAEPHAVKHIVQQFLDEIGEGEKFFYTYPRLHDSQVASFTRWRASEPAQLITCLEAQCQ